MAEARDGKRKKRDKFPKRVPDLGYYYIVTDTQETERNYLYGLRDSLPDALRGRIVIKVTSAKTAGLVDACAQADMDPQYRQCWIVFDRDEVPNFDQIVAEAERKGIKAGWSNPCIEIWFAAYFGGMPAVQDSVSCCRNFAGLFERRTGQEYKKANSQIYAILNASGDEEAAIQRADKRLKEHLRNGAVKPSLQCPATTLYGLVDEIRRKTGK